MAITHSVDTRNALADLVDDLINAGAGGTNGYIEFTNSSGVDDVTTNVGSGFHIANVYFSATAFDAAGTAGGNADGVMTAATMFDDTNASAGTAAKFYARNTAGTKIFEGSVNTTGADINLSSVAIGAGDTIRIESLTYEAAP